MGMVAQQNIEGFLASENEAAKTILETVKKDGFILVFSHLNAHSPRCSFSYSGNAVG
jgi:hypothetical protein